MEITIEIEEVKLEIYIPEEFIEKLRDALADIGICRVGNYSHVISYQNTKGFWKPLENSNPYNGTKGEICAGCESKMEVRCPVGKIKQAMQTIRKIHPYEEPLINIIPLLSLENDSRIRKETE